MSMYIYIDMHSHRQKPGLPRLILKAPLSMEVFSVSLQYKTIKLTLNGIFLCLFKAVILRQIASISLEP